MVTIPGLQAGVAVTNRGKLNWDEGAGKEKAQLLPKTEHRKLGDV